MTITILYFLILISLIKIPLFLISNYFSIKMYGGKRSADMASFAYDKKRARIQHASVAFLQAGEIVRFLNIDKSKLESVHFFVAIYA